MATSSESAETRAALDCGKTILHAVGLLKEMNLLYEKRPVFLLTDNTATLVNLNEGRVTAKTKHDALAHNFVRELVQKNIIQPWKISTMANKADMFTKTLQPSLFLTHRGNIMGEITESSMLKSDFSTSMGLKRKLSK